MGVKLCKQLRSSPDGTIFHIGLKPPLGPVGSKRREIFSMLYKSLVRPILEYACPVWSPYLIVKDKLAIEKVQRRASRIALGLKLLEMSYEERCILLNWNTVQHQREYLSVVECYKSFVEVKTLEPTIHSKYKLNQLKLTHLSTPSSWESSKAGTVCQTISSLTKLTLTNFKKA